MPGELDGLSAAHPLPPGWSAPRLFSDEIEVGGPTVRRAGIACSDERGAEVTGSAAQVDGSPLPRAWFELLERAAIFDAADRPCVVRDAGGRDLGYTIPGCPAPGEDPRRRPARSNGVALHTSWERACEAARLELIERDRVLRAWCGELDLEPMAAPGWLAAFDRHDWRVAEVSPRGDLEPVSVVVGFPRSAGVPLARGFAARPTRAEAADAAASEAVQSLAFIWDEPVPAEPPALEPSPMFHLDRFLWPGAHDRLRRWLDGEHARYRDGAPEPARLEDVRFVDLTPGGPESTLRVARAIAPGALPLVFGELPDALGRRLPPSLRVHPIA